MVGAEQRLPKRGRRGGIGHAQLNGPQRRQGPFDARGVVKHRLKAHGTAMIHGRAAAHRQVPAPLQFQQQRAAGHVLEPTGRIEPLPGLCDLTRQPRAMPVGMLAHQLLNPRDVFGPDQAPLQDFRLIHARSLNRGASVSPVRNEVIFRKTN